MSQTWTPPRQAPYFEITRGPGRAMMRWNVTLHDDIWVAHGFFFSRRRAQRAGEKAVRRIKAGQFVGYHF